MDRLDELESKSIYIIREAYAQCRKLALLWSIGKDSTTMLWIARKAFLGTLPFPVLHLDTSYKFEEIYRFRELYAREWNLQLLIARNQAALQAGMNAKTGRLACCHALKTEALKMAIAEHGFQALALAIRRDEHGIRAKERYFSPRDPDFRWNYASQPAEVWNFYQARVAEEQHLRVHPMLHWTELDIWRYIRKERIPTVSLYFARAGKRYRSIGCATCCQPVASRADTLPKIIRELETTTEAERSGRAQDKEDSYAMQKLRSLGYM